MLMNDIKQKQISARILKNIIETNLYTTLLGELSTLAKNKKVEVLEDVDVIPVLKKFIKNCEETLKVLRNAENHGQCYKYEKEILLLTEFLPKQLDIEDLKYIFMEATDKGNASGTVPSLMAYLKVNYAGQYDGALASKAAKEFCSL